MQFTEEKELNDITNYARSLHVRKAMAENPSLFSPGDGKASIEIPIDGIYQYEKLLADTPPKSTSNLLKKFDFQVQDIVKAEKPGDFQNFAEEFKNSYINASKLMMEDPNKKISNEGSDTENNSYDSDEEQNKKKQESTNIEIKTTTLPANINFDKLDENIVSKSYYDAKNMKSHLRQIMDFKTQDVYSSRDNKVFRVFMFTQENIIVLGANPSWTIIECIKQIITNYMTGKNPIENFFKYPERPEAYDLRTEFEAKPLEKTKQLKEYRITKGQLFLTEDPNFDPLAKNQKDREKESEEDKMIKIIIYLPDEENAKFVTDIESSKTIKDLLQVLSQQRKVNIDKIFNKIKGGYTVNRYNVRIYSKDIEIKLRESKNYIDGHMPLRNIKVYDKSTGIELELIKKKFMDDPNDIARSSGFNVPDVDPEDDEILYNDVSANAYEEFKVTKINEEGKRQTRLIGIDGYKISNFSGEAGGKIANFIGSIIWSRNGTMNPERYLKDVMNVKLLNGNAVQIEFRMEGNKIKITTYETTDRKIAKQIYAKLQYLKKKEKEK